MLEGSREVLSWHVSSFGFQWNCLKFKDTGNTVEYSSLKELWKWSLLHWGSYENVINLLLCFDNLDCESVLRICMYIYIYLSIYLTPAAKWLYDGWICVCGLLCWVGVHYGFVCFLKQISIMTEGLDLEITIKRSLYETPHSWVLKLIHNL